VDLKTPLQDVEQKVVLDNIRCDEHQIKMACLFCRTCDHPVCQVCVSRIHNKHKFETIENILSKKMDELKEVEARYCKDLTLCQTKVKEFQVSEAKCESVFDETITQIKQKEESMIGAISKYSIEVQNEDEIEQKTVKKTFSNLKRQIDQAEKTIIHHQEEIMTALDSTEASTILTTASEFKKRMSDLNFNPIPSEIKYFLPEKESDKDIPNLFGSLQKMRISKAEPVFDFEVVNSYIADIPGISNMVSVDDKTAWIHQYHFQIIKQIHIDNDNITTIQGVYCKIINMALTSNNNLLMSLFNDSDLKILTKLGEIKPFLSVSPFIPWGVHVTDDNDIIVGVIDTGPHKPTDTSVRALLVFGMDCKQRHCHRYDSNRHAPVYFTMAYQNKY